jgi:PTS system mannose-specific IIA component/fructoselysine and glucoselysine-specific PTS system IIA component
MIATHSILAEGFKKAADFFTGQGEDIVTVCAYDDPNVNPRPEIDNFFNSLKTNDSVVVFSDLLCGSINQILTEKLKTNKFHLITDVNLSVIIGVSTLNEEDLVAENIRENIELAKNNLKYMNDALQEQRSPEPKPDSADDFLSV